MSLSFPPSPNLGDVYGSWVWNGQSWDAAGRPFAPAMLRSYLAGLTLSTSGSSNQFQIAAGQCANSTNSDMMQLTGITKTTLAWGAGSGVGSLDTGSIANNIWYHVHVIKNVTTQAVDALISLSPTAPTLPTGYTLFRRIGSLRTTASGQWMGFNQFGDEFLWSVVQTEIAGAAWTAANIALAAAPGGIRVLSRLQLTGTSATPGARLSARSTEADTVNAIPADLMVPMANGYAAANVIVRTDTSAQIALIANVAFTTVSVYNFGYFDRRGRDA